MIKVIPAENDSERVMEQNADVPVPPVVAVVEITPEEHISERAQIVDVRTDLFFHFCGIEKEREREHVLHPNLCIKSFGAQLPASLDGHVSGGQSFGSSSRRRRRRRRRRIEVIKLTLEERIPKHIVEQIIVEQNVDVPMPQVMKDTRDEEDTPK